MKVLFVASGNKAVGTVSAFVQSQYDSLVEEGLEMILFPVVGHGFWGYLKQIVALRRLIRRKKPDIIHAHYSSCGYLASLASFGLKNKIVVSILGSFPIKDRKLKLVRWWIDKVWNATIVKSERTRGQLDRDVFVIPNGVNIEKFNVTDQNEAREKVGFEVGKKYVIFVSNPARSEKCYPLAQKAVDRLGNPDVVLTPVYNKTHEEVVTYMCAADTLLMTSYSEGSPNVIKEAMACNCPIVVTDVGDVHERLDGLDGCYVAKTRKAAEISELVGKALAFGQRTEGRKTLIEQGLTTQDIAKKIVKVYDTALKQK